MRRKLITLIILILYATCLPELQAQQTVRDIDGNIYVGIAIGKQVWLGENLKVTKFNDGKPIPLVTDEKAWKALKTPGYCYFNNNSENKDLFGALYNWRAVSTGKLCPKGWHVPTKEEWTTMVGVLGDINTAGDKLKETGNEHWQNLFINSTNDYDFSALPGGTRLYSGVFPDFGSSYAVWWLATSYSSLAAWNWGLYDGASKVFNGYDNKQCGFSIRCIKD